MPQAAKHKSPRRYLAVGSFYIRRPSRGDWERLIHCTSSTTYGCTFRPDQVRSFALRGSPPSPLTREDGGSFRRFGHGRLADLDVFERAIVAVGLHLADRLDGLERLLVGDTAEGGVVAVEEVGVVDAD